jgi:aldehyde:ferredoxin oxidoreductase
MARGYMGKMLWVDLTGQKIEEEVLGEDLLRQFLGGYGLGARILYSRMKPLVDPLGPENILGLITGPLTGSPTIGGTRYTAVGKSPLTGGWGDANSGGDFGTYLKFSGYDAVFFIGISEKPVYLYIEDGHSKLFDAACLWGKDCYETEDLLKSELGNDVRIACVGPSGEKISRIAAIMNDRGRAAGRSGLGAVMGSKRLKAVVAKKCLKISMVDEALAREFRKKYIPQLCSTIDWMRVHGTSWVIGTSSHSGDSPVKNWKGVGITDLPDIEELKPDHILTEKGKRYACYQCPMGCGAHMKEGKGEHKYDYGSHRPEYETLSMFGPNCQNNNLSAIIKANDLCNRYGLDTISAGSTIAFAMECYEKGILTRADLGGLDLTWGNHIAMIALLQKMAERDGIGDIMADGTKIAAKKIGKGAEQYAMHVGGQEIGAHEPKLERAWGLGYEIDPTPGRHTQNPIVFVPSKLDQKWESRKPFSVGELYRIGSAFNHVINSVGVCAFIFNNYPSTDTLVDFMKAVTGWDITSDELITTGERILAIRQAFNVRENLNTNDFKMPDRLLGQPPFQDGPLAGAVFDEENLRTSCYMGVNWDLKTTKPSKQKLLEVGLPDVAADLWG